MFKSLKINYNKASLKGQTCCIVIVLACFMLCSVSCKKVVIPTVPGVISGKKNLCPGETGAIYSIDPVEGSSYYLWTVPEGSKIVSGQGTTSISIDFGKNSGAICVRSNNDKETSEPSCFEVTQGGVKNVWCREMDFKGGARSEAVGFSIGNKGYFGTGVDSVPTRYNDFWEFDPALNTWTQVADFGGVPRLSAVGFTIGNKGYIGTGYTVTQCLKDFWEYDPLQNKWTQKADCGAFRRTFAFGFSVGNKGYIGAGRDSAFANLIDFYQYDPVLNQWTQKADAPKRQGAVGFSIGTKGYLGAGIVAGVPTSSFYEYDPLLDLWTAKTSLPATPRYAASGFSIGSKGYIGLGFDGTNTYSDFYEYDPLLDSWTQKADFGGDSRGYSVGFSIQKNGYIGTGGKGNGGKNFYDFWVYGQ